MEPRYIEGPRDCQNLFVITRFRYIECFHLVYNYWGTSIRWNLDISKGQGTVKICSLYRVFSLSILLLGQKNTVRYADDNTQLFLSFLLNFHFTFFICYYFGSEFFMSKIKSMKLLLGPVYMEVGDPR